MVRNGSSAFLGAAVLFASGCAKRTDAEIRSAWGSRNERAAQDETDGGPRAGEQGDGPRRRRRGKRGRRLRSAPQGWARVERMLGRASAVMLRSPGEDVLAHIAHRWCEIEPEPLDTEDGWVRVCEPEPPVEVEGHVFTLEVGQVGVIGLVASDLSGADSTILLEQALQATRSLCTRPWQEIPSHQFHTCPIDGGPTLAVGRLSKGNGADDWQVSISVLGAG